MRSERHTRRSVFHRLRLLPSFLLQEERNLDGSLENINPCIVGLASSGFGVNLNC